MEVPDYHPGESAARSEMHLGHLVSMSPKRYLTENRSIIFQLILKWLLPCMCTSCMQCSGEGDKDPKMDKQISGTGASGTGASGAGASGTGASGTGASGTGASGTGASGAGPPLTEASAIVREIVNSPILVFTGLVSAAVALTHHVDEGFSQQALHAKEMESKQALHAKELESKQALQAKDIELCELRGQNDLRKCLIDMGHGAEYVSWREKVQSNQGGEKSCAWYEKVLVSQCVQFLRAEVSIIRFNDFTLK